MVFKLGRVPQFSQTDNSTSATHDIPSGKRGFNADYEKVVRYFQMEPRTIAVGEKEQNGDVEAAKGALKRRLKQHLLLRGSRDFENVDAYEQWVQGVWTRPMSSGGRRSQSSSRRCASSRWSGCWSTPRSS